MVEKVEAGEAKVAADTDSSKGWEWRILVLR